MATKLLRAKEVEKTIDYLISVERDTQATGRPDLTSEEYGRWLIKMFERLRANIRALPDATPTPTDRVYTRAEAQKWRDDAFEAAAKMANRYDFYGNTALADDIRALKSS